MESRHHRSRSLNSGFPRDEVGNWYYPPWKSSEWNSIPENEKLLHFLHFVDRAKVRGANDEKAIQMWLNGEPIPSL